jgi:tetratricopeptide (TPR) repeat protein
MQPKSAPLELVPLDEPKAEPPQDSLAIDILPVGATPPRPSAPGTTDRFLREATQQHASGHVDQPLWDHALAQANGDNEAATAIYLRARATALRLLDRDRRAERRAASMAATQRDADPAGPVQRPKAALAARFDLRGAFDQYRIAIIVAGGAVSLAIIGWIASSLWITPPTNNAAVARVAPAPKAATPAVAVASSKTVATNGGSPSGADPELMKKIQQLRDAQNWNVLVLYLVEWTRQDPKNPDAWNQLRAGYVTLGQKDDALGAAKKAVELAPAEPRLWRSLGEANLDLDDTPAALRAFEQAAARDERDADSLRHAGLLNAQLGKVQEAKVSFDAALAVNPGDSAAMCMRAAIIQMPAGSKDFYGLAQQVKAIDRKCRGQIEAVATRR